MTPTIATAPDTAVTQTRTVPARQNPPARPHAAKPETDSGAQRFLIYLRLHWLTILFCGALLGCGGAYAAWTLMPPKYESYALFQVTSSPSSVTGTDPTRGKTEFATYLKTTASLFKTELVYIPALRDYGLIDLPTLQAEKDPFKYFDEKLVVETKEGSEIIRLSVQGENPDDMKRIVDAISAAYFKKVVQKEIDEKTALRNELEKAKASLEGIMRAKNANRPDPLKGPVPNGAAPMPGDAVGPAAPPAVPVDPERLKQARFPLLIQRVAKLETELPAYDLEISAKKAQHQAAVKDLQLMLSGASSPESMELAKKEPDYLQAQSEAMRLRRDYQQKFDALNDPNTEAMVAMARKKERAEIDAKKILDEKAKAFELAKRKPVYTELTQVANAANNAVTKLTEEKRIAQQQLIAANKELAATSFPAGDPRSTVPTEHQPKMVEPSVVDYLTHEKLYERVTAQLIAADYDLKLPKRVQVIQAASTPAQKDTKKQLIGAIFAALMGFVAVGASVVAYESRARRVSSLGEMKSSCATPVVAVVPWIPGAATARDPVKRADVNEAIDKLRAYFAQTWLNRGATTVAVTSALGDEGKSFTSFGLASSLAQAGYKTLLVDFDLREPSLHTYAGVPNALGVCELLRGEADFRKTIQTLPNGLHFLAAGKWSDEARQAAVGGRLDALLMRLKEPFDCIVLHGHALLTAAESVEVARRSDVVLLCAQYRESRIPLLKRAAERIATMEIPYSGIVYVGASTHEALC